MTFRIPEKIIGDRFLAIIGKKRAISIPADAYNRCGPYVILQAKRKPFLRVLVRPKNQKPPNGWFYPYDFQ